MRITGPTADPSRFLTELNPGKLASLVADILSVKGHEHVRIVDGPGDGGRDIHSQDEFGRPHVAQCKFRGDTTGSVSSREISELPMAMAKFGYQQGLFATNGRISPQAKREFID